MSLCVTEIEDGMTEGHWSGCEIDRYDNVYIRETQRCLSESVTEIGCTKSLCGRNRWAEEMV